MLYAVPNLDQPSAVYDLLRIVIAACALWLSVLVLRLGWTRTRPGAQRVEGTPHYATYLSYAGGLLVIAVFRVEGLGAPPDRRMWISLVLVALGMYGVLRRTRLSYPRRR
jgi:hypothetical protein